MRKQTIELVALHGAMIDVKKVLQAGDRIVLAGLHHLTEGMQVRYEDSKTKAP